MVMMKIDQDQVFKITETFGIPPDGMLKAGRKTSNYFKKEEAGNRWERVKGKKDYRPVGTRLAQRSPRTNSPWAFRKRP